MTGHASEQQAVDKDRVMRVIVTGAASGIGLAVAKSFIASGAQVLMADRAAAVVPLAATLGAKAFVADLARPEAAGEIVAAALDHFGGLEVLVSNAGINIKAKLADFTAAQWDLVQAVNTRATWALGVAALPALARTKGCIIATTSVAGSTPTPMCAAYAASKAAQIMLIRQMALEWGPMGVRANCVSPGAVPTALSPERYSSDAGLALAKARSPLGEIGRVEDIAHAIHFLAQPEARFITGAQLVVDGGMQQMAAQAGLAGLNIGQNPLQPA